jgi:drug/metabolite transporter (DMT)-like permease
MEKRVAIKLLLLAQCGCTAAFTGFHQTPFHDHHHHHRKLERSTRTILEYSRSPLDGEQKPSFKIDSSLPYASIESAGQDLPPIFTNGTSYLEFDRVMEDSWMVSSPSSTTIDETKSNMLEDLLSSYWGPRILLAAVACLYGTNFPLGSIMDHALPASAATSARFVLASLALSPFVVRLHKDLIPVCLLAGCFTGMGYVAQSLALVDTSPATVSFLGAVTVVWCPFLEWLVDKKPMGIRDRPQTWIAAILCLVGVGVLELCGGGDASGAALLSNLGIGDGLAILQAIGFGTGIFLSERMMKQQEGQALPITSVIVATTSLIAMVWSLSDGWIGTPGWESMALPNMLFDPSMSEVAFAVVWTGLLSTSLNFFLENVAIGKVSAGEASVILATEPLWAAAFAAAMLGESFGWNDYMGGFFIVAACLMNTLKAEDIQRFLPGGEERTI